MNTTATNQIFAAGRVLPAAKQFQQQLTTINKI
jgi:hypothetical protein